MAVTMNNYEKEEERHYELGQWKFCSKEVQEDLDYLLIKVQEIQLEEEVLLKEEASQAQQQEPLLKKIKGLMMETQPLVNSIDPAIVNELPLTDEEKLLIDKISTKKNIEKEEERQKEILVEETFKLLSGVNVLLSEATKMLDNKILLLESEKCLVKGEDLHVIATAALIKSAENLIKSIEFTIKNEPLKDEKTSLEKAENTFSKNEALLSKATTQIMKALALMKEAVVLTKEDATVKNTDLLNHQLVTSLMRETAALGAYVLQLLKEEKSHGYAAAKFVYLATLLTYQGDLYKKIITKIFQSKELEMKCFLAEEAPSVEEAEKPMENHYVGKRRCGNKKKDRRH